MLTDGAVPVTRHADNRQTSVASGTAAAMLPTVRVRRGTFCVEVFIQLLLFLQLRLAGEISRRAQ